jgi:hypothetical protein
MCIVLPMFSLFVSLPTMSTHENRACEEEEEEEEEAAETLLVGLHHVMKAGERTWKPG